MKVWIKRQLFVKSTIVIPVFAFIFYSNIVHTKEEYNFGETIITDDFVFPKTESLQVLETNIQANTSKVEIPIFQIQEAQNFNQAEFAPPPITVTKVVEDKKDTTLKISKKQEVQPKANTSKVETPIFQIQEAQNFNQAEFAPPPITVTKVVEDKKDTPKNITSLRSIAKPNPKVSEAKDSTTAKKDTTLKISKKQEVQPKANTSKVETPIFQIQEAQNFNQAEFAPPPITVTKVVEDKKDTTLKISKKQEVQPKANTSKVETPIFQIQEAQNFNQAEFAPPPITVTKVVEDKKDTTLKISKKQEVQQKANTSKVETPIFQIQEAQNFNQAEFAPPPITVTKVVEDKKDTTLKISKKQEVQQKAKKEEVQQKAKKQETENFNQAEFAPPPITVTKVVEDKKDTTLKISKKQEVQPKANTSKVETPIFQIQEAQNFNQAEFAPPPITVTKVVEDKKDTPKNITSLRSIAKPNPKVSEAKDSTTAKKDTTLKISKKQEVQPKANTSKVETPIFQIQEAQNFNQAEFAPPPITVTKVVEDKKDTTLKISKKQEVQPKANTSKVETPIFQIQEAQNFNQAEFAPPPITVTKVVEDKKDTTLKISKKQEVQPKANTSKVETPIFQIQEAQNFNQAEFAPPPITVTKVVEDKKDTPKNITSLRSIAKPNPKVSEAKDSTTAKKDTTLKISKKQEVQPKANTSKVETPIFQIQEAQNFNQAEFAPPPITVTKVVEDKKDTTLKISKKQEVQPKANTSKVETPIFQIQEAQNFNQAEFAPPPITVTKVVEDKKDTTLKISKKQEVQPKANTSKVETPIFQIQEAQNFNQAEFAPPPITVTKVVEDKKDTPKNITSLRSIAKPNPKVSEAKDSTTAKKDTTLKISKKQEVQPKANTSKVETPIFQIQEAQNFNQAEFAPPPITVTKVVEDKKDTTLKISKKQEVQQKAKKEEVQQKAKKQETENFNQAEFAPPPITVTKAVEDKKDTTLKISKKEEVQQKAKKEEVQQKAKKQETENFNQAEFAPPPITVTKAVEDKKDTTLKISKKQEVQQKAKKEEVQQKAKKQEAQVIPATTSSSDSKNDNFANNKLAITYFKEERYKEAEQVLLDILNKDLNFSFAYLNLAQIYQKTLGDADAISTLEKYDVANKYRITALNYKTVKQKIKYPQADRILRLTLVNLYQKNNKLSHALRELKKAKLLYQEDTKIIQSLAIVHGKLNNWDSALFYAKQTCDLGYCNIYKDLLKIIK